MSIRVDVKEFIDKIPAYLRGEISYTQLHDIKTEHVVEELEGRYGYLRVRENWHKRPILSKIMCWLGRHDYEVTGIINDGWFRLECFYCHQIKNSKPLRSDSP